MNLRQRSVEGTECSKYGIAEGRGSKVTFVQVLSEAV